jgi:hypothetical protein
VIYGASHRAGKLGESGPPRPYVVVREGDPKRYSTVLVTDLGSWAKPVPRGHTTTTREADPKGWSPVLVTALGSSG